MNLANETENDPKLRFAPCALIDIKGTWEYLSEQDEEAAGYLIREILKKCQMLSRNPKIGRVRNDLVLNLRQFPFKNYYLFYFQTDFGVEIFRVLHSSRDVVQVFDNVIDESN